MSELPPLEFIPGLDTVLEIEAIAPASLTLNPITDGKLEGTTYKVPKLTGKARNIPHKTKCTLTWVVRDNQYVVKDPVELLYADGKWEAGDPEKDIEFKEITVPVTKARMFGRGEFELVVTPQDVKPDVAAPAKGKFDHNLSVSVTPSSKNAAIGTLLQFRISVDEKLYKDCWFRLALWEADQTELATITGAGPSWYRAEKDDPKDLAVTLPAWKAKEYKESRGWLVGCAGEQVAFRYPEADEAGGYEFGYCLEISTDSGKSYEEAIKVPMFLQSPRPTLSAFSLEFDRSLLPRTWSFDIIGRSLTYRAKVVARGSFTGFAPGLDVPLEVALWCHQDKADMGMLAMRRLIPPQPVLLRENGTFEHELIDLETLKGEAIKPYVEEKLFAVLSFPIGLTGSAGVPVFAQVAEFDDDDYHPFEDMDFPRGAEPQATATGVCSKTWGAGSLPFVQPKLGDPEIRLQGYELKIRVRLEGGDAQYWKDAEPALTWEVDGKTEDLKAKLVAGNTYLAAPAKNVASTFKHLHGKTIKVNAEVKKDATLRGNTVAKPTPSNASFVCKPKLGTLVPEQVQIAGKDAFKFTCPSHYVPTTATDTWLLMQAVETVDGKEKVVNEVKFEYAPSAKNKAYATAASDTGMVTAYVKDAKALERIAKGDLKIKLCRPNNRKVFNLDIGTASCEF